ncbi:IS21 family transposase [Dyella sp. M7H15-1]|uniref:IS21 family transposase n=1 Tax=Dyella sp. M7H15-1 TaxID=2501295 RepID=UPI001005155D|nr:IS21 family transposase [Dyella sp. M7H15-1]QAU24552.1 IS21 family transposase [Dyella sp. M7H15-1]
MRKIRELLRLKFELGLSERKIAQSLSMARSSIKECLNRVAAASLSWPLPDELDDVALEASLYPCKPKSVTSPIPWPDFAHVHRELSRSGVTRPLLWQEYKAQHPDGPQYSAFCDRYSEWSHATAELVMRLEHRAGEKCFVDYAGQTVEIINRHTGELHAAQIFVAALGCSNYIYAEATLTQNLSDWIGSHARALTFFGDAPTAIVPDNLKSGVHRPDRYEPQINRSYADFAAHYDVAILPARVRKPRDKAKVEGAVLIVERSLLAPLRDRQFFSLTELNAALRILLDELNHRPFQKLAGSRHTQFLHVERPALKPLPVHPYEFAQWKYAKVHPDYHIEVEHAYYSVPYTCIGQRVDVRLTARMIEVFAKHKRIATHPRSTKRGERITLNAHRPPHHCAVIDTTLARLIERVEMIAPSVADVLREQSRRRLHPEEAIRSAQGILRLAQDFSPERLANACTCALALKTFSYQSVRQLIINGEHLAESGASRQLPLVHDNVRGPECFH